jgi:hypothetical protein
MRKGVNQIGCDFCEAVIEETRVNECDGKTGWSYAQRGRMLPFTPICELTPPEVKHSCPNSLCQARLLVWSRS